MSEFYRTKYLYHVPFTQNELNPYDNVFKARMSYSKLKSVSVSYVTQNVPVTREYFRSLDLGS